MSQENKEVQTTATESTTSGAEETATKRNWLDRFFKLRERGSNIKTEVVAGITTFMAMAYILMVNASMFAETGAVSYGAIYIATALSAIVGTLLIGFLSGLPLAQACGMGLNAYFVYTCVFGMGFTYANALIFILIDGIVFVLLTVTGLRKKIFNAIPQAVRVAIPAGIGLFIAFVGMQNAGLVVDSSTLVGMGSLNIIGSNLQINAPALVELGYTNWLTIMPIIVTILGIIAIAVMSKLKIKGAILYGILGSAALYYLLGLTTGAYNLGGHLATIGDESLTNAFGKYAISVSLSNPFDAFAAFGTEAVGKVFTEGFDFSQYLANNSVASLVIALIATSLSFCMVDMFDTLGTLYGACSRGGLLTDKGEVPNMNKAMLADAIATCTGAVCGVSTVTTFVESSAGIGEGGKTGLTSVVVALGFLVAMFLSPIAQLIPNAATAPALIYVGVLMMNCVKDIEWTDPAKAVPAFLTIAMMSFAYNISFGIGFGIISYVLIKLFTGKAKEVTITTYVLAALFLAMFLLTH